MTPELAPGTWIHRPGDAGDGATAAPVPAAQLGLWFFLATTTMLFAGFTSAYLVRQSTGSDWRPVSLPPVVWLNTVALLLSSAALEWGRRTARVARSAGSARRWLLASLMLGLGFLAGQVYAWQQMAARGLTLSAGPHASFFYVLSGVHGVHLIGGIAALGYATVAAWRALVPRAQRLTLCATYWHFMGGLWLYVLLLLLVLS